MCFLHRPGRTDDEGVTNREHTGAWPYRRDRFVASANSSVVRIFMQRCPYLLASGAPYIVLASKVKIVH